MTRQEIRREIWGYLAQAVGEGFVAGHRKDELPAADYQRWCEEEEKIARIILNNFAGGRQK